MAISIRGKGNYSNTLMKMQMGLIIEEGIIDSKISLQIDNGQGRRIIITVFVSRLTH